MYYVFAMKILGGLQNLLNNLRGLSLTKILTSFDLTFNEVKKLIACAELCHQVEPFVVFKVFLQFQYIRIPYLCQHLDLIPFR